MSDFDDRRDESTDLGRPGTPYQQQHYGAGQFGPALGQPELSAPTQPQPQPAQGHSAPSAQAHDTFGAPVYLDPPVPPSGSGASNWSNNGANTPAGHLQWQPGYTGSTRTESAQGQFEPTAQWGPASMASTQYESTAPWQTSRGQTGSTTQLQPGATAFGPPGPARSPYGQDGGLNALFGDRLTQAALSPNRRRGGRGIAWVAAAVAALVVAGGVTAIVVANSGPDDTSAQNPPPSMVSALTTTGSHTPPSTSKPSAPAEHETAVVPGYQVVVASDLGAAYDVPADWTVAPDGKVGGFGEPPNAVTGKGLATEGKSYCPGSTRTVAFLTGSKDSDSATAATELGTTTAKIAYTNSPGGTPSPPQPLSSLDGSQQGMFVETKGTATKVTPGCAADFSVYTFATPTDNGSFVMVIAADTGVPNAVDAATAMQIFTSIRPHAG
ncbi:hypothetical protein ACQP1G_02135 [Nocardia sp. CA-107356]|uniref:hypothetical protein n=1 Tax=Nocardia sp. CA-107356 TaxID=3239972 RepID=UPI003D8CB4D9